jgi:uncharacterized ParB-like nuclease family protein
MASIAEIREQEPIDVLEVDGRYYGFSGCHCYQPSAELLTPRMQVHEKTAWVLTSLLKS